MKKAHPFVKWVGGKTQLLKDIRKKYPKNIIRYCEPFVGGGAVLFDVLQTLHPSEVLINDINSELINTYDQLKNNIDNLITELSILQDKYLAIQSEEGKKSLFLTQRSTYNSLIKTKQSNISLQKAALFIFLNKTCFNGLYRVNSKGIFNSSFNKAMNPLICDKENLLVCHSLLENVNLISGDYSKCEYFIEKDTFVFIDPPYRPITQTSAFTSYSKEKFDDEDQIKLAEFINAIVSKGAYFLASNSDPKNTDENDNFFDDLYKNYEIERVYAKRMINSNAQKRGAISELLITNITSNTSVND